jgi:hypothetical protein
MPRLVPLARSARGSAHAGFIMIYRIEPERGGCQV